MSRQRLVIVTLVLLNATACGAFRREPAVKVSAQDQALNTRWHANLVSPAVLAGAVQMSGSASMAPSQDGASTTITIDLANASPGGLHPWQARYGQCGVETDQGAFGPTDAYRPLQIRSDGRAEATVSVPMQTPKTGRYFVVVRASTANSETVVACGNLAPPTQ